MQIKDCIQDVLANAEILDYIPNVNLTALGVNIMKDYHSRYIQDYLILNSANDTIGNISDTIKYLTNVLNRYKYSKLYATLNFNYNPIWNVDGTEITEHLGTDTSTNVGSGTQAHTGKDTTTSSNNQTSTNVENGTHAHTGKDTTTVSNNQSSTMGGSDTTEDTTHTDVTSENVSKTNTQLKNSTSTNTSTAFSYGAGETTSTIDLSQKGKLTLNGGFDSSDYDDIKSGGNLDITANVNKLVDSNLEISDNLNHGGVTETKTGGHSESTVGGVDDNYTLSSGNADENYVEYKGIDTTDTAQNSKVIYGKTETVTQTESTQIDYNSTNKDDVTNTESVNHTGNNQIEYNTLNTTENTNTETKNYNSKDKVTRQGNIGVTSTQSLIAQERDISMFSLYDVIAKDIVDFICTSDYGYC